jgi:hypothetical protein
MANTKKGALKVIYIMIRWTTDSFSGSGSKYTQKGKHIINIETKFQVQSPARPPVLLPHFPLFFCQSQNESKMR